MTRAPKSRTLALAVALVLATVLVVTVTGVPFALADGPPDGMVGVSDDAIGSDLPACGDGDGPGGPPDNAGGGNPICGVHEDLQDHSVYTSAHADTLNITVTNPGQAKKYTSGSVFGSGPVAIVFSDDTNSAGRDVALPTAVIEDIFGHQPHLARGTHEDGERWASPIAYQDGYAVFEIPHFSDQVVTMEGEISLTSDSALAGDSFSYEIENGSSVENLTFELTGVDHLESASTIQELANGDSFTHDVGGNLPADGAILKIEGVRRTETATYDGTASSSATFNLDGNTPGEVQQIEITGKQNLIDQSMGGTGTTTVDGTSDAYNVEIEVTGQQTSSTSTGQSWTDTDSMSDSSGDTDMEFRFQDGDFTDGWIEIDVYITMHWSDGETNSVDYQFSHGFDLESGSTTGDYCCQGDGDKEDVGSHTISKSGGDDARLTTSFQDWTYEGGIGNVDDVEVEIQATEKTTVNHNPEGVEVSFGSESNYIGSMSDGETVTETFQNKSPGDLAVDYTTTSGDASITAKWTEVHEVVDPEVSIGGDTVLSRSGVLGDGETASETLSLSADLGTNSISISQAGSVDIDWNVTVEERWDTEDPTIDVDSGGSVDTYSHSGILDEGETKSWDLGSGHTGSIDVNASALNQTDVIVNLTVDEVTQTEDPAITINGNHTVSYDGTLADGETIDLTSDASLDWVEEGENTISVSAVAPSVTGPAGQVGLNWRHSGDALKTVTHSGEVFSEVSTIEHTWVEDQSDAKITVGWASDRIIRLGELTVTHNGSEISDPSYAFSESDIIVNVGSVQAGETTKIDLTGWKIAAENGDIKVTSPTDVGSDLVTTFEVTNATAEPLKLNVGGHEQGHLLHNLDGDTDVPADWDIRIYADGSQTVRLPDVSVGDSIRIETTDLEVDPASGDVVLYPVDADEPRFETAPGTTEDDTVEIIWHDTTSGHVYELEDLTNNEAIETAKASSPVSFTVKDVERTLRIIDLGEPGSGGGSSDPGPSPPPTAPISSGTTSIFGLPAFVVLILAIAGAFGGLYVVSRSTGDDTPIDTPNVPVVSDALSRLQVPPILRRPRGGFTFGQLLLLLGAVTVMLVSIELVTARSLIEMVTPSAIPTGDLVLLGGAVSLLLSVWLLHSRTGINLPDWLLWTAAGIVSVGTILVLDDGIVLDSLGLGGQANEFLVVIVGIGILLALWQLDVHTTDSIPRWLLAITGGITVLYVLETIQEGVILGGLSEGFETVSPLFWLTVIVGGAYFARGYIKAMRSPDTSVTFELEGDGK